MAGITFYKEKVHLNLAKIKVSGENFEVDVDPDSAIAFKKGAIEDLTSVLKAQQIFKDAKKGLVASEQDLRRAFGSTNVLEVAKKIIDDGEIQLTAEYRERVREEKRKKIIGIIHTNAVDPQTHLPHPPQRIEAALEEAKVRIDELKTAEDQVDDIVKQIRPIIPIKFEIKELEVRIPAEYAAKSYSIVKSSSKIIKDDWQPDGSWLAVVEIPGGLEDEFYDKINSFTHGNNEIKVKKTK